MALPHYDCEKSLDLSLPWEKLLSISVMDDEKSMVARKNFGFRYVHWALLEFQGDGEIVEFCLHCPEAREYELALEEIPLFGADSLVPYFKLDETDFLSDVEIVLDADDRAYSLTIGSAQGRLVQIISGEFDNLYEEKFGCKKVKFIDEMMLFFPTRQYSKADFESSCVTNSFSVQRREFDQPNTK